MTVIAAVVQGNTMAIAGDRAATDGNEKYILARPKVCKMGPYLVGYYGSVEGDRLFELFSFPVPPKNQEKLDKFMYGTVLRELERFYAAQRFDLEDTENGLGLVIAVGGRIYDHCIADGSMLRFEEDFFATGSGGPYAMGALYASNGSRKGAKTRVEEAVTAACQYSTGCALPVDSLTLQWTK